MFVPESMQLGAFKNVRCVSTKDIYERVGPRGLSSLGSNDGSTYSEAIPMNQSKLDVLQRMSNEDYAAYAREQAEIQRKLSEQQEQEEDIESDS